VQTTGRLHVILEPSWAVLEFELASVLHCIVKSYWERMQAGRIFRPTLQVPPRSWHMLTLLHWHMPHPPGRKQPAFGIQRRLSICTDQVHGPDDARC
jgi:hypothetical protein